ncbi:hypothetical protein N7495_003404 [Penicillium taxi]|uniref:uncharacterized protein n=1 Tax=Penicillium taxi TaxID=168475 RepID=UPI0025453E5E|nr:uncharacterized protein N7495_003404 [Penicillium taxi]KAJ5902876.1 hypothetical protein N7495_003404 [Penicillium taxi]
MALETDIDLSESLAVEIHTIGILATSFVSYSTVLGLGRHTAAVAKEFGEERVVETGKWQIIGFPFNIGAFSLPNISIAILIVQLLDPNPIRAGLLYGMVILQAVSAVVNVFIVFFQCSPPQKLWMHTLEGTCWSVNIFDNYSYWVSAFTTFTDIVLAIVPIAAFWRLQLRKSTKFGICIMMGLTMLSAVVTIIKATYLHLFSDVEDPLWNVVPLVLWGLIEQNVVIIAACIPTLRPFFRKTFKSTKGSSDGQSQILSNFGIKLSTRPIHASSEQLSPSALADFPHHTSRLKSHDEESNESQQDILNRGMEV